MSMIIGAYQHERTVGRNELRRTIQTQFWYGTLAAVEGDLLEYFPQQQLHRMMSSYHERKLKEYELTEEFQKSQEEIYLLLIQLHKSHLKEASENKVWRIIACHADTNLEASHDQIIGPAMG